MKMKCTTKAYEGRIQAKDSWKLSQVDNGNNRGILICGGSIYYGVCIYWGKCVNVHTGIWWVKCASMCEEVWTFTSLGLLKSVNVHTRVRLPQTVTVVKADRKELEFAKTIPGRSAKYLQTPRHRWGRQIRFKIARNYSLSVNSV